MTQLDSTLVNVSLSSIRQELHSSIDTVQWIYQRLLARAGAHAAAQCLAGSKAPLPATTQFPSDVATYAGQILIPLFLITGCGISSAKAGWMLAPMGLGMMCVYPSLGFLTDSFGCRAVSTVGTLVTALATLSFLWMSQNQLSPILLVVSLFARGAGQGAIGVPSVSAAYASVPKEQLALATTATNIVQRLGGPIGTTVMAIVLSPSAPHFPAAGPRAYMIAFIALIGLQLILLSSTTRLPVRIHQSRPGVRE